MSVIGSNILAGASGQGGGYNLTKSLRFRKSASAYLNRTPASAGNQKTFTFSTWLKRGGISSDHSFFTSGNAAPNPRASFEFTTSDTLYISFNNGSGWVALTTSAVYRDPSAWYHIVVAVDTTQATSTNRVKLYVNGSQVTAFSSATYPNQNDNTSFNDTVPHSIGSYIPSPSQYLDGYLAEVNFVDGQALTPSSFGQTSATTGVWIPKKYTGSYGTNGFYLDFEDTSSTAALGYDAAGSNDWTANNISLTSGSTYDSMTDVPTLTSATTANYCVINAVEPSSLSVSNGNLKCTYSGSDTYYTRRGTIGVSSGKYYFEYYCDAINSTTRGWGGIATAQAALNNYVGVDAYGYGYSYGASSVNNNSFVSYGATYTTGDVIGVAFDADAGTLTFYKNGTSQGTAFTGIPAGTYFPAFTCFAGGTISPNFGQRPFSYTPPTGFVALNTFNLPTPTIGATASTQAITYMGATTYSGDSTSNRVITTGGGSDFVWIKRRNSSTNNILFDVLRGAGATLYSNLTNAEAANGSYYVQTFGNTSFTLGTGGDAADNITGGTYVAWNWKANGAGVTNTAGSITSTVSANTTAGFSVVTYTGTGSNATVGHGLGVAPAMFIVKRRNAGTNNWLVYHQSIGGTGALYLNTTETTQTFSDIWNNTAPTSTVFSIGTTNNANQSTGTYVAYCFAQVAGYSAFGSYTGNGSTDGPFIFTGFRPRFFMTKCTSSTSDWHMTDTARYPTNSSTSMGYLDANTSAAEGNFNTYDGLSNGFKVRDNGSQVNGSGATYIYMAFAENPFKYANAR
jgi:hypothetical protein